jgi:hypothetical protein
MEENKKGLEQAKEVVGKIVEENNASPVPTTIPELWKRIDERLSVIESKFSTRTSGRGPSSTRSMTADDAVRIMTGDLSDNTIKECVKELGLSYGQIYSARGGYTFKTQYALREATKKAAVKK